MSDRQQAAPRLCIFARAPELGRVKSRLAAELGPGAALAAHRQLVAGCLHHLAPMPTLRTTLWIAGQLALAEPWAQRWRLPLALQVGADLGARMAHAIAASQADADRVLVVGTDCPLLDAQYVAAALTALDDNEVVLGPAEDGGYVLIGMRQLHPQLFTNVTWGTAAVCAQTLAAAQRLDLQVAQLPTLWDVDTLEDWQRYQALASGLGDGA